MPHDAREIMRVRLSRSNVVTFASEMVPALIPEDVRRDRMVGKICTKIGADAFRNQCAKIATFVRRCGRPARFDWLSSKTGKLRIGVMLPNGNGQITLRVFAEASEVAGLAVERRGTGTHGG